jgi:hydrogenase 3 maturation protease
MPDLREQIQQLFQGRVCLMGLGNVAYGDDGLGVRLAEAIISSAPAVGSRCRVIIAGTTPEWLIGRVVDEHSDQVVFVDAVEFGGSPGSVVLLNSDEMAARFPQVSTHKLSLGLLAKQIEANGRTKAWLLGVQPESLRLSEELTPSARATLELLLNLLAGCLGTACLGGRASSLALTAGTGEGFLGSRGRSPSQRAEVRP